MQEASLEFLYIVSAQRCPVLGLEPCALRARSLALCTGWLAAVAFDFLAPAALTSTPYSSALKLYGLRSCVGWQSLFIDALLLRLMGHLVVGVVGVHKSRGGCLSPGEALLSNDFKISSEGNRVGPMPLRLVTQPVHFRKYRDLCE